MQDTNKIAIIGDSILDTYIYCSPRSISAEAPVIIMKKDKAVNFLGGAANVAANVNSLGNKVFLLSLTGKDLGRSLIYIECSKQGINAFFITDSCLTTSIKTRVVADGQQIIRVDEETISKCGIISLKEIDEEYQEQIFSSEAIIFSDYGKGTLRSKKFAQEIITKATGNNIPIFVDPIRCSWDRYDGVFCLTPNLSEFEEVSGFNTDGKISNIEDIAQMLINKHSLSAIVITLGKDGACLVEKNKPTIHFKAHSEEVFDVCGAGDTFIAALVSSYSTNKSLHESTRIANIASGIAVKKHGTSTVTKEEIEEELKK
jgi:rfaE bifunctional protein kinase chain/domain